MLEYHHERRREDELCPSTVTGKTIRCIMPMRDGGGQTMRVRASGYFSAGIVGPLPHFQGCG
ncbi:hypothetical protein D3OALGB2SA_5290 [Olavius algarvensis associated proteobacterium Delta 3]|nr:hypothetical protein D3OALGB2SA_5290 [Olavius algarvensis associated proteobacterium Delta 3]